MNKDEILYTFDTQGFVVLKDIINNSDLLKINNIFDSIKDDGLVLNKGAIKGKNTKDYNYETDELYISNIVEHDKVFYQFIDNDKIIDIISLVTLNMYRLNHTYSIQRSSSGSYTYLHMGALPMHPKAIYSCNGGQIFSSLTKVVFPISGTKSDDGCFGIVPGSHKANFIRPWGNLPDDNKLLQPIEVDPGDAIIFTEALAHGSLIKKNLEERRTLYYCYSVGYMPDWGKMNLSFSEDFINELSNKQKEIVRLK